MGAIMFFIIFLILLLPFPIFNWLCNKAEKKAENQKQSQRIKEEIQRHITFEENRKQTEGWNKDDI